MSDSRHFPKVLILGHSFNNYNGMGITLTNFFADWPQEKIAILANSIDVALCDKIRPCSMYIGSIAKPTFSLRQNTNITMRFKRWFKRLYYKTGLNEINAETSISREYVEQAQEFNPDMVFCALGSLVMMKRCEDLMNHLPDTKLVLYIVDDWVNTKVNTRFFSKLWWKIYDKKFRKLLSSASGLLSICQYMSDEYMKQYGCKFYPFHNPVNLNEWNSINVKQRYQEDIISIVYMGKINSDTVSCLKLLSNLVEDLSIAGYQYILDIYSPDYSSQAHLFENFSYTHVFPPVAHEEVSTILKSYSALFLPLGFSKQSRSYVRLSMPTKLSEYLASKRPILLYCPEEIALARYLKDKGCAVLCTDESYESLRDALMKLHMKDKYVKLVEKSSILAKEHDVLTVREKFRETLNSF